MLRKFTFYIAAAALAVIILTGGHVARAENPTVITTNGGFESGVTGWKIDAGANPPKFSVTNKDKHSGTNSLMLTTTIPATTLLANRNPLPTLTEGKMYIFTFWYKMDVPVGATINANGFNSFLVYVRSGSKTYLAPTGGTLINDKQWHQYSQTFTAEKGFETLTHLGVRDYNIIDGAVYYFDDFDLRLAEPGEFENGNFEQGSLIPWIISSNSTNFTAAADEKYSGTSSLKITGTNSQATISQTVASPANSAYELRFMSKGNGGGKIQICNNSGIAFDVPSPVFTEDSDWKKYIVRFNSGASNSIMIKITDTLNGTRYFDDFVIEAFSGIDAQVEFITDNTASVRITNYTTIPQAVYAILGAYDPASGIMAAYNIAAASLSATGGGSDSTLVNLSIPAQTGKNVLVFLWDGQDTMKPISKIFTPNGSIPAVRDIEDTGITVSADLYGNVTISGGLGAAKTAGVGALKITKTGFMPTDDNVLLYAFPVGPGGGYFLSFKLPQTYPSGTYNVTVRGTEFSSIRTESFYFINQNTVSGIVSDMNKISDANTMLAFITVENYNNLSLMGLAFEEFDKLEKSEQQRVCDILIKAKVLDIAGSTHYGGFNGDTLKEKFKAAVKVFKYQKSIKAVMGSTKYAVIEDSLEALGADVGETGIYAKVEYTGQQWAIDKTIATEFVRVEDIIGEFEKYSALALVNVSNKSLMRHYLLSAGTLSGKIAESLKLDLNKLINLGDTKIDRVFEMLTDKNYDTLEVFREAFDGAIQKATAPSTERSGGGKGLTLDVPGTAQGTMEATSPAVNTALTGNITWGEVFDLLKGLGFVLDSPISEAAKIKETPFAREMVHKILLP